MGIIPYAVFFFVSVMVAFWLGRIFRRRKKPWWWVLPTVWVLLCVAWTVSMVFMPLLMVFQLGLIMGASYWSVHIGRLANLQASLRELREQLKEYLKPQQVAALERVPENRQRLLTTKQEHLQALDDAISQARVTLCITSGWINNRAMNPRRVRAIREATERGVHVFIVFGYRSGNDEPTLDKDARSVVKTLHELSLHTRSTETGQLVLAHWPVHSKIVVKDNAQAIVGSSNWLSNSSYKNQEHSAVIENVEFATLLRDEVMHMAREADADTIPGLLAGRHERTGRGQRLEASTA